MSSSQGIELLKSTGLTDCQARVYLSLCSFEIRCVKSIAKCTKIHRQDVYRITEELMKLGLVEKIISNPIAFRAIPLDRGISILLKRRKETIRRLESNAKIFLAQFPFSNKKKPFCKNSEFVLVPPKEAIIDRINNSINQAQSSIDVVSSWKRLSRIMLFSESFEEAWSRGVKLRLISEKPKEEKSAKSFMQFCRKTNLCDVRFIPSPPSTVMSICDQKEVNIFLDPKAGITESSALWTNNPSIVAALKEYFNISWITAMETPAYGVSSKSSL